MLPRRNSGSVNPAADPVRLVLRRNLSGDDSEDQIGDGVLDEEAVLEVAREATFHLQILEEVTNACQVSFTHTCLLGVEVAAGRVREDVVKLHGLLAYAKSRDETTFRIAKSQLDSIQKRYLSIISSLPSAPPAAQGSENVEQDAGSPWYTQQQAAAQHIGCNQYNDFVQRNREIQAVEADIVRLNTLFQEVQQLTTMQGELLDLTDENVEQTIVENGKAYEKLTRAKRWRDKVMRNKKKVLAMVVIAVIVVAGIIVLVIVLL